MNKKLIIGVSSAVLLITGSAVALHGSGSPVRNSTVQVIPDSSPAQNTDTSQTPVDNTSPADQTSNSIDTSGGVANTNDPVAPTNPAPADTSPAPQPAPAAMIVSRSGYYSDTGSRFEQHCVWNYDDGSSVDKIIGGYNKGTVKIQYDCPNSP